MISCIQGANSTLTLTLFRIALSKSLTLPPLYFRYLPRLLMNTLSSLMYQSLPTTVSASVSSMTNVASGGSSSITSNRSEASHKNDNLLAGVQKKGCVRHSGVSGLFNVRVCLDARDARTDRQDLWTVIDRSILSLPIPLLLIYPACPC